MTSQFVPSPGTNFRSLLLIGVGLPTALSLADRAVLATTSIKSLSPPAIAGLFGFYVMQIALVSWVVARFITPWPLRWILWIWTMALIDLQVAVISAHESHSNWHAIQCLCTATFAGQFGAFIVWGILGRGPIVWRGPSLFLLLLVGWNFYVLLIRIAHHASWMQLGWTDLFHVETFVLSVLCGILRLCGYSLEIVDEGEFSHAQAAGRSLQFSIRDVLIWTTSLAVLLGIAKAGDLLTMRLIQQTYVAGFMLVATVAISTAVVLLVAIWAALGLGSTTLRALVLALSSLAVGTPLACYSVFVGKPRMLLNYDYRFAHWYETGYWWIGWTFLAATLLTASLIFFRTLGYRLEKMRRQRQGAPAGSPGSAAIVQRDQDAKLSA
jgi:hypothetical protein